MIVFSIGMLLLLGGVIALIPLGLRAGDRPGDTLLLEVAPTAAPRGAMVTVANPGDAPVILGMSLRRVRPRLRLEANSYVRVRTGALSEQLRADAQAWLGVLGGGETLTVLVPAGPNVRRRAELMAVIGQSDRLRTIHRLVVLRQLAARPDRMAARRIRKSPARGARKPAQQQERRTRRAPAATR